MFVAVSQRFNKTSQKQTNRSYMERLGVGMTLAYQEIARSFKFCFSKLTVFRAALQKPHGFQNNIT